MSRQDIINELHRPIRKNFKRRHVVLKSIDDLWQADLVEMIPYSRENNGFKYLLTVIDCFSKYAWAKPIKNKTSEHVQSAMQTIFKQSKRTPNNLQTDHGKEFYNKSFQNLMKRKKINHYSTFTKLKSSIVERFNRTLKERMWKEFSMQGSYKWLKILDIILSDYNNRKHRTINMAPVDVSKENEEAILKTVYKKPIKFGKPKFKIGDHVRVSKEKMIFEKGYTPNYSTEIFRITHVNKKIPITYLLEDYKEQPIFGRFYEYEIQKVKHPDTYLVEKILKEKNSQVLVRWLGFDSSHDSWINKNEII